MTSRPKIVRRLIVASSVLMASAGSFLAAAAATPGPATAAPDLACVWVGQIHTGACVVAPTKDGHPILR